MPYLGQGKSVLKICQQFLIIICGLNGSVLLVMTALFVIKYINLYQQPGSSNLIS